MKHGIFRLLCLAACLAAPTARAAESQLSLDDCFAAALKQSEVMADQAELVSQAEAEAWSAWGGLLPSIYGYGSYFQEDQPASLANASSNPGTEGLVRVSGSFNLFHGFRDYAAVKQAGASIQYQKEALNWASLQLYGDVAQAYFAVAAYRGDLDHLDKEVEFYDQRVKDLQERVRIGRSRPTEVLMTHRPWGS